ncbi:MAG: fatty acid cis/trans isomerase [Gammaproteobacteria bacterium]
MENDAGLKRGASKQPVYDGTRLREAQPTRLHKDAKSEAQWRKLGFHRVLGETDNGDGNASISLMSKMLELRRQHPLPPGDILPKDFDFSAARSAVCPSDEEFDAFSREYPLWSMPFGLADLSDVEYQRLQQWLGNGAKMAPAEPLAPELVDQVRQWEVFFNADSIKRQLVSRYLYEHLFLAHLYFVDAGPNTQFFKLVRSRTPPGQPIDIVSTRRPYEDPGTERIFYRLWRDSESIVDKTHMPYALNPERLAKWRHWFIEPDYEVAELPGYDLRTASNPFISFEAIPSVSRHRFLLDEAEFTIMNFIKGPVCRGSVALNVIQDHFWVFFTTPGFLDTSAYDHFLAAQGAHLRLPAEADSGIWSIAHWLEYAGAQQDYLRDKLAFIHEHRDTFDRGKIDVIWDGDGDNPNAALTVFRHHDSATVVKGLVGANPKTAWVIDYPTLERIHYLLVAGFDVFGSASHQAMSRLYMDFLRMESEMNFLAFLPPETRKREIEFWYRDSVDSVRDYLDVYFSHDVIDSLHKFHSDDPKSELFKLLRERVAPALDENSFRLEASALPKDAIAALHKLNAVVGRPAALLPETVFINIRHHGALTILANRAYSNISSMFREDERRLPAEDGLIVMNGFVGAYPNVFIDVSANEIPAFVEQIVGLRTEADYSQLLDRFGIRRTSTRFWSVSDELHAKRRRSSPIAAGIFDFNRLENR